MSYLFRCMAAAATFESEHVSNERMAVVFLSTIQFFVKVWQDMISFCKMTRSIMYSKFVSQGFFITPKNQMLVQLEILRVSSFVLILSFVYLTPLAVGSERKYKELWCLMFFLKMVSIIIVQGFVCLPLCMSLPSNCGHEKWDMALDWIDNFTNFKATTAFDKFTPFMSYSDMALNLSPLSSWKN